MENGACNFQFSLQCDWEDVLRRPQDIRTCILAWSVGGKVWVTLKFKGKPSVHGNIERIGKGNESDSFLATEGFRVVGLKYGAFHVAHESTPTTVIFLAPVRSLGIHSKGVSTLCVNSRRLVGSAGLDEKVLLWNGTSEDVKCQLQGHFGQVYKIRYFPSGEVIITCGADMRLMIWCAKTGRLAVTFTGHTMAVTDADFIDRGKNVVSCSRDGTCRLWNCGDSSCIEVVARDLGYVNSCRVIIAPPALQLAQPNAPKNEKEVGTLNKIVLLGTEDSVVHCFALGTRQKIYSISLQSAVNCLACHGSSFYAGLQDGSISCFTLDRPVNPNGPPPQPRFTIHESASPVLALMAHETNNQVGLFTSRNDGTVSYRTGTGAPATTALILTGSDFEPVCDLASDNDRLYAASRDAKVRIYTPFKLAEAVTR